MGNNGKKKDIKKNQNKKENIKMKKNLVFETKYVII